jgi:hypothetical protein
LPDGRDRLRPRRCERDATDRKRTPNRVPVVVAIAFGRRRPRSAIAWMALALGVVVIGLVTAIDAQPSQWCLY